MVKILSQAGNSLADMYDVEGSIAGIDQLETTELPIVHEMGGTVFSERFSSFMRKGAAADLTQSTSWEVILTDLPAGPIRVMGLAVEISVTARVALASVAIREPIVEREMPVFIWDGAVDPEVSARNSTDGVVGLRIFLRPLQPFGAIPYLVAGAGQPQRIGEIAFRGSTTAFGAGTVDVSLLVHLGFSQVGGISSRGLPIPSW